MHRLAFVTFLLAALLAVTGEARADPPKDHQANDAEAEAAPTRKRRAAPSLQGASTAQEIVLNIGGGLLVAAGGVEIAAGAIDTYLHLIKAHAAGRYQIGNNKGRVNGWIDVSSIFGVLVTVEP